MFRCSRRFKTTRRRLWAVASRKQGKCSLPILILYAFSLLLHYCIHLLNSIPTYTFRIGICIWVVMLSPAAMSVVQVFHIFDVEFSLCWVWRVLVFHPSWCEMIMVRFDAVIWPRFGIVETVGFRHVLWLVMLESTKDRILGVDTSG
jgi:hypothetical protein